MIDDLVVWGGNGPEQASHRWIHAAFARTAQRLGIPTVWTEDSLREQRAVQPGSLVISADIYGRHIPYVPGAYYVLHNFDGSHPLCRALEQTPERLLRLQVWTDAASGEDWGPFRSFNRAGRVLFQPWGSDLMIDEFLPPVFNPDAKEVVFVGSVWSEDYRGTELGNKEIIAELETEARKRGLVFRHLTQVSDAEQRFALRTARLTPAFAGAWQVAHDYLPCRSFKLPAYGCAMFSNVPAVNRLFGLAAPEAGSVGEMLDEMLALDERGYRQLVREQQAVAARFTYAQSLATIARAFTEIRA